MHEEGKGRFLRITVVGDGTTGKTCMLIVYKDRKFEEYYIPTVFDTYSMNINIDGEMYVVSLSDTAGQEDYDKLRPLGYTDTDVFIVCYSVDNFSSYSNVSHKWIPEVRHHRPTAKVVLVATKCDLRSENQHCITDLDGVALKRRIRADEYVECSSKRMWNVDRVFETAIRCALAPIPKRKTSFNCVIL